MATLNATNLKHASSSSNNIVLAADGSTTISNLSNDVGKILQVVQTYKTDTFSEQLSQGSESSDITGLTASITPSSATNKILIMFDVAIGGQNNFRYGLTLYKAGSVLTASTGDADGNISRVTMYGSTMAADRQFGISGKYLDTAGGTSSITYSLRARHGNASTQYVYVNRASTMSDHNYRMKAASSIILMEVAA